jgi:oligopeptide transport system substrate-binding protein
VTLLLRLGSKAGGGSLARMAVPGVFTTHPRAAAGVARLPPAARPFGGSKAPATSPARLAAISGGAPYPRPMKRLLAPLLVLILFAASALIADRPLPRADLVILNRGEVSTLDATQMSWLQDFRVAVMLFDGLTRYDLGSPALTPVPALATSWQVSPDAATYTFHLRDAVWSNGDPISSHDFVYSWRRSLLPENAADYARLFQLIKGGREFYAWRTRVLAEFAASTPPDRDAAARALWDRTLNEFDRLVGLRAPDDRTLVVELERPTPYFLDVVSFVAFAPQHPASIRAHERLDPRTGAMITSPGWTQPGSLVTSGAFTLEAWRFKRDMRLARNPRYWDEESISIRSIAIPVIADANAQVLAFRSGAVDWTSDITPGYRGELVRRKAEFDAEHAPEIARLRAAGLTPSQIDEALPADSRNLVHAFPSFGTYFYNFNCRPSLASGLPNPFADARVRRAFAMCVDKAALTGSVRRIGEPAAAAFIPPGSIGHYPSPVGLPFDPPAARALLDQSGYSGGRGLPTIELLYNSEGEHDQIAQAIAKTWERELGVEVRMVRKEVRTFREDVKSGRFMISRASWFGDYGDPTTFLDVCRTGDGNNDRGYTSAEYDRLLDDAAREFDPERRFSLLSRAESLLVERDLPLLPLFHYSQLYLYDPHRVRGVSAHPRQVQYLHRLRLEASR